MSVKHHVANGTVLALDKGFKVLVAPATGQTGGDLPGEAAIYLSLPPGKDSVVLTVEKTKELIALLGLHLRESRSLRHKRGRPVPMACNVPPRHSIYMRMMNEK